MQKLIVCLLFIPLLGFSVSSYDTRINSHEPNTGTTGYNLESYILVGIQLRKNFVATFKLFLNRCKQTNVPEEFLNSLSYLQRVTSDRHCSTMKFIPYLFDLYNQGFFVRPQTFLAILENSAKRDSYIQSTIQYWKKIFNTYPIVVILFAEAVNTYLFWNLDVKTLRYYRGCRLEDLLRNTVKHKERAPSRFFGSSWYLILIGIETGAVQLTPLLMGCLSMELPFDADPRFVHFNYKLTFNRLFSGGENKQQKRSRSITVINVMPTNEKKCSPKNQPKITTRRETIFRTEQVVMVNTTATHLNVETKSQPLLVTTMYPSATASGNPLELRSTTPPDQLLRTRSNNALEKLSLEQIQAAPNFSLITNTTPKIPSLEKMLTTERTKSILSSAAIPSVETSSIPNLVLEIKLSTKVPSTSSVSSAKTPASTRRLVVPFSREIATSNTSSTDTETPAETLSSKQTLPISGISSTETLQRSTDAPEMRMLPPPSLREEKISDRFLTKMKASAIPDVFSERLSSTNILPTSTSSPISEYQKQEETEEIEEPFLESAESRHLEVPSFKTVELYSPSAKTVQNISRKRVKEKLKPLLQENYPKQIQEALRRTKYFLEFSDTGKGNFSSADIINTLEGLFSDDRLINDTLTNLISLFTSPSQTQKSNPMTKSDIVSLSQSSLDLSLDKEFVDKAQRFEEEILKCNEKTYATFQNMLGNCTNSRICFVKALQWLIEHNYCNRSSYNRENFVRLQNELLGLKLDKNDYFVTGSENQVMFEKSSVKYEPMPKDKKILTRAYTWPPHTHKIKWAYWLKNGNPKEIQIGVSNAALNTITYEVNEDGKITTERNRKHSTEHVVSSTKRATITEIPATTPTKSVPPEAVQQETISNIMEVEATTVHVLRPEISNITETPKQFSNPTTAKDTVPDRVHEGTTTNASLTERQTSKIITTLLTTNATTAVTRSNVLLEKLPKRLAMASPEIVFEDIDPTEIIRDYEKLIQVFEILDGVADQTYEENFLRKVKNLCKHPKFQLEGDHPRKNWELLMELFEVLGRNFDYVLDDSDLLLMSYYYRVLQTFVLEKDCTGNCVLLSERVLSSLEDVLPYMELSSMDKLKYSRVVYYMLEDPDLPAMLLRIMPTDERKAPFIIRLFRLMLKSPNVPGEIKDDIDELKQVIHEFHRYEQL